MSSLPPPSSSSQSADLIGRRIAHFRVTDRIGEGGMGVVYKAVDERLERVVALKVLAPGIAADAEHRARFLREARAEAAVTHPNIATVYEVDEADGRIFLALEYIDGESLRQKLARGPLEITAALEVTHAVSRALARAHAAGVVHRDLKPDNVMVTSDGHVKVLDFGLAQLRSDASSRNAGGTASSTPLGSASLGSAPLSTDQHIVGTPAYMAPEQLTGGPVDARTDFFSLGVLLYELLTGQRPFGGQTVVGIAAAIVRDEPVPPSQKRREIPPAVDALVMRCLAKRPEGRYARAEELCAALEEALPETTAVRQLSARTRAQLRAHRERSGWKTPVIIAAGAVVAGVVVALTPQGSGRPGARPAVSAEPPPPQPTALTDLPLPTSAEPKALAAYRIGIQALRDASWGVALESFRRAVELDPGMAMAHLRLAQIGVDMGHPGTEVRASYQRAVQLRDQLSPRDQALLEIIEPMVAMDPPDMALHDARIEAARKRFPMDAEFLVMGLLTPSLPPEAMLDMSERALAIDPRSADALQMRARALANLDRGDEAQKSIEQCLAISPASNDCLRERALIFASQGECSRSEADLRRLTAVNPTAEQPYGMLASIMATQGKPRETVEALLEQRWARLPEPTRPRVKALDRARLAFFFGDFLTAEREALEADRLTGVDTNETAHAEVATVLVAIYGEMDRPDRAGLVADAFLKRREAWTGAPHGFVFEDVTAIMVAAKRRAGLMSVADARAAVNARLERLRSSIAPGLFEEVSLLSRLLLVETPEEARALLPELDALGPRIQRRETKAFPVLAVGRAYEIAGEHQRARGYVDRITGFCEAMYFAWSRMQAFLLAGRIHEAVQERGPACEAYRVVLQQWGDAKPRSESAAFARERTRVLGCH